MSTEINISKENCDCHSVEKSLNLLRLFDHSKNTLKHLQTEISSSIQKLSCNLKKEDYDELQDAYQETLNMTEDNGSPPVVGVVGASPAAAEEDYLLSNNQILLITDSQDLPQQLKDVFNKIWGKTENLFPLSSKHSHEFVTREIVKTKDDIFLHILHSEMNNENEKDNNGTTAIHQDDTQVKEIVQVLNSTKFRSIFCVLRANGGILSWIKEVICQLIQDESASDIIYILLYNTKDQIDKTFEKLKRSGLISDKSEFFLSNQVYSLQISSKLPTTTTTTTTNRNQLNVPTSSYLRPFEISLEEKFENRILAPIEDKAQIWLSFLNKILNILMTQCSHLFGKAHYQYNSLERSFKQEQLILEALRDGIRDSEITLKNSMDKLLNPMESRLLHALMEHEYPNHFAIKKDGFVSLDDLKTLEECQESIQQTIHGALFVEIRKELEVIVAKVQEETRRNIQKSRSDKGGFNFVSFAGFIENFIDNENPLDPQEAISRVKCNQFEKKFNTTFSKKLKLFLQKTASHVIRARANESRFPVTTIDWKTREGKKILSRLRANRHELHQLISQSLSEACEEKTSLLKKALDKRREDTNNEIVSQNKSRARLAKDIEKLTVLYMRLMAIITQRKYLWKFSQTKEIGKGSQGVVYKYHTKNATDVAVKHILCKTNLHIGTAFEVFLSSTFTNQRLLPIQAVRIDECLHENTPFYQLFIIRPLLLHNINDHLKIHRPKLLHRIGFALQVAEALLYLHQQGLVHQDLRMTHILVNNKYQIVLSGFGFTRKKSLLSFGGSNSEDLINTNLIDMNDIFHFGDILFCLAEGTGERLMPHIEEKRSPSNEEMNEIGGQIKYIMKACWNFDHRRRPTAQGLLDDLKRFRKNIE